MRRAALVLAALVPVAPALAGCETTAEKSAKLERIAKLAAQSRPRAERGLSIVHRSTKVTVLASSVLSSAAGAAATVTLRNQSATTLREVPIQITVRGAGGASLYSNTAPGLAAALVSVPSLPAHGTLTWVDDQLPAEGSPGSVSAEVGEGRASDAPPPRLSATVTRLSEGSSEPKLEGELFNHSSSPQREVVVYALARRGARIVAAGRAVLPQAPAAAATRFELYFVGAPRGARLQLTAVAGAA